MHIIVCIKQVPDSTEVKINPETGTLIRAGVPSILNPYDHYAVEMALKVKKQYPDTKVSVISMGPPQAKAVIQLALALGCDEGYLLTDRAFAGSDTWATSYALSCAIRKIGNYDLIVCGMQAIDGDTAQVGPGIATHLDIPQITFCEKFDVEKTRVIAEKITDNGHDILEAEFPLLLTMYMPKGYELRYPSFVDIYEAAGKKIHEFNKDDIGAREEYIGLKGSPTQVSKIYPPKKEVNTVYINGTSVEIVNKLIDILKQENFIK